MIAPQTALRALRRLGPSSAQALAADLRAPRGDVEAALRQLAVLRAVVLLPRRAEVWRATEAAGVVARRAEDAAELIAVLKARPAGATATTLGMLLGWRPLRTEAAIRAAARLGSIRPADDASPLWIWASAARRTRRPAPTAAEVAMWGALRAGGATWAEVAYRADRPIEAVRAAVSRAAKKDREIVQRSVDSPACTH